MRISDWSSDVCSSDLLFQHVQQSGHRPALTDLAFDRSETLRFGQGLERCNRYPVVAAPQEPDLVVLWNIGIEEQQFPFKLLPDRGAKRLRIWRQAEAGIVRISPDLEVLGKIVIGIARSEEHTSELQSLMRLSYAVFCLKKKNQDTYTNKFTLCRILHTAYY